jgi:hypothetical protein
VLDLDTLRIIKSVHPHELANLLGIDYKPTVRGCMMPAVWREDKCYSVSYLMSPTGQWYWTDFGTGDRGSHIDLIMKSYDMSYSQSIYRLRDILQQRLSQRPPTPFSFSLPPVENHSSWSIHSIKPCSNAHIKVLEEERQLNPTAIPMSHLKWLKIFHIKKKFYRTCYGIKNSSNGHELFSGHPSSSRLGFKSCLGKKDISVINRKVGAWVVAESIIDVMSVQQMHNESKLSMISLNGVHQISRLKMFLDKYHDRIDELIIAMDHDSSGESAQEKIIEHCQNLKMDHRVLDYTGKDPNEALISGVICKKS